MKASCLDLRFLPAGEMPSIYSLKSSTHTQRRTLSRCCVFLPLLCVFMPLQRLLLHLRRLKSPPLRRAIHRDRCEIWACVPIWTMVLRSRSLSMLYYSLLAYSYPTPYTNRSCGHYSRNLEAMKLSISTLAILAATVAVTQANSLRCARGRKTTVLDFQKGSQISFHVGVYGGLLFDNAYFDTPDRDRTNHCGYITAADYAIFNAYGVDMSIVAQKTKCMWTPLEVVLNGGIISRCILTATTMTITLRAESLSMPLQASARQCHSRP